MPLLANDMHLLMSMPAIWYENHLASDALTVTGVTFPGIPGVVAGHNGHVAWGFTNGLPGCAGPLHRAAAPHGRRPRAIRVPRRVAGRRGARRAIAVKGAAPAIEEVIVTRHGPIINALAPGLADDPAGVLTDGQALALRWTALEPDRAIEALRGMNRARTCPEFREALRDWAVPVQNMVYADTQGNIGYSYPGRIPIRAQGDGRVPVPGWTGEYEWTGYVPFEELPHLYNPPQGYIVTANNRVADALPALPRPRVRPGRPRAAHRRDDRGQPRGERGRHPADALRPDLAHHEDDRRTSGATRRRRAGIGRGG